jgi:hypothetical protein
MATATHPAKQTRRDAFQQIFEPTISGCSGACNYTWDSVNKRYILEPGDGCAGAGCSPCVQYKSSSVRELVILEQCFQDVNYISHTCGGTTEDSLDAALRLFVELLKWYRLIVKFTIGLAFLSAALLAVVVYLLVR